MTTNLAKHLNGVALRTPPEELCCFRKRFDMFPEMLRRSFYSFSNYLAARHIYDTLQTQPVVLDRYFLTLKDFFLNYKLKKKIF